MDLVTGNAALDGSAYRGWFVGHFMPDGLPCTDAVEVKWGVHALDEVRPSWAVSAEATTLSVVVRGSIRLYFEDGAEALLCEPGDYALWPPGLAHRWRIEEDNTVIVTLRWPSKAGDVRDH